MKWYEEALKRNKTEIISGAIFAFTSALALLLWHYSFGNTFTWVSIQPISTPLDYGFYTSLVFIGPGAYLYYCTNFYKNLWHFFRTTLHKPQLHKDVKWVIRTIMALAVIGVVIAIVALLNAIASFFYNIFRLILFIWLPVGVGLIIAALSYLFLKKDLI